MNEQTDSRLFVVDSFALLALFFHEPAGPRVLEMLHRAARAEIRLLMTVANVAEVVYRCLRDVPRREVAAVLGRIPQMPISLVNVDLPLALAAGRLKAPRRLSLGDSLAAALTLQRQAILLTGDPAFRQLEDLIQIEWLPQRESASGGRVLD